MTAELVVLRETNLLDVPATLRNIATAIEAGEYGNPLGCAVVLDADRLEIFYCGTGEAAPNTHLLLGAGMAKMLSAVMAEKL